MTTTSRQYISSSYSYDTGSSSHIFGAKLSETDSLGKTTRYFYNSLTGQLEAVIYPDLKGEAYTYDDIGNLTSVMPAQTLSDTSSPIQSQTGDVKYTYDSFNRLSEIEIEGRTYEFTYDVFGNTTEIDAGNHTLVNYTYNNYNGKLNTLEYGNGDKVKYFYDNLDRIEEIQYTDCGVYCTAYMYTYDSNGNIIYIEDYINGQLIQPKYDSMGRFGGTVTSEDGEIISGSAVYYDEESRISYSVFTMDSPNVTDHNPISRIYSNYLYDNNGNIYEYSSELDSLTSDITPSYDNFGRLTSKSNQILLGYDEKFSFESTYGYVSNGYAQSYLVSNYHNALTLEGNSYSTYSTDFNYTYDAAGNITEIKHGNVVYAQYIYDDKGQLTRENNYAIGDTYVWTYDNAGNITSKKTYAYTTGTLGTAQQTDNYVYASNSDRLTSYKGQSIVYDEIGNPTTYRGKTLTWINGRQLESYDGKTYAYNADGIRIANSYKNTKYIVDGSKVMRQTWTDGGNNYIADYSYDEKGFPLAFAVSVNGGAYSYYVYETNLQGDIVAIYDINGSKIVSFSYDAWGNFSWGIYNSTVWSSTFQKASLFRYRGYIYDIETGLYYLQTRYYDPQTGRFLNADDIENLGVNGTLTDKNLYAYCDNNPIMLTDPTGEFPWVIIGIIAVIVIPTVVNHIVNAVNYSNIDEEIEDSYTKENAKNEIDEILSTYSNDCYITFGEDSATIMNSYEVTSRYDRQKISEIISRTELTNREYDNMSAEWVGHNVCYRLHIKRDQTTDVDIDYGKDRRWYVNAAAKVLEILGWD